MVLTSVTVEIGSSHDWIEHDGVGLNHSAKVSSKKVVGFIVLCITLNRINSA